MGHAGFCPSTVSLSLKAEEEPAALGTSSGIGGSFGKGSSQQLRRTPLWSFRNIGPNVPLKGSFKGSYKGFRGLPHGSFRKLGGSLFWGALLIRILLFRVLYQSPLFSDTPTCPHTTLRLGIIADKML